MKDELNLVKDFLLQVQLLKKQQQQQQMQEEAKTTTVTWHIWCPSIQVFSTQDQSN